MSKKLSIGNIVRINNKAKPDYSGLFAEVIYVDNYGSCQKILYMD